MKSFTRLSKAASLLSGISVLGISLAHGHPLPETETNANESVQHTIIQKRRAEAEERRVAIRANTKERRRMHKQEVIKRKAKQEAEKARRLGFKNQLLDMLVDDGVIKSREQRVNVTYIQGHPVANGIDLHENFGDKYNKLWKRFDHIISTDSYMNITQYHYEVREITKDGRSRHYQMSFN